MEESPASLPKFLYLLGKLADQISSLLNIRLGLFKAELQEDIRDFAKSTELITDQMKRHVEPAYCERIEKMALTELMKINPWRP